MRVNGETGWRRRWCAVWTTALLCGPLGSAAQLSENPQRVAERGGAPISAPPMRSLAERASSVGRSSSPVPCDEEYVRGFSSDDFCYYALVNENYFAVLTTRSGPAGGTGEEVEDLVTAVDSDFRLHYSSRYQPATHNASEPPFVWGNAFSLPNATSAPADVHVFFRPSLGAKIEGILDALVAQRTKEWFFSPLVRNGERTAVRDKLNSYHEFVLPRLWIFSQPEPSGLEQVRSLLSSQDRVEHQVVGSTGLQVFPATRNGLEVLEIERDLREQLPSRTWTWTYPFTLPGEQVTPTGGPSTGPGGAAAAVPLSDWGSLLLAAALGLGAFLVLRRR
ncbi:MAG: hypothetical protein AAGK22_05300 [Acidobacteriota bacterium]